MANRPRSAGWVIACWCAFVALWLGAGWPGWLSADSIDMMHQAQGLAPFTDWHSPLLSFAWRMLSPRALGPIGPFTVQAGVLWCGLLLVALWLHARGIAHAWLLFPCALAVRATWVGDWIWKDAAILALLSLAVGVSLIAESRRGSPTAALLMKAAPCLLGAAAAVRWYMSPALAFGALALAVLASASDSTRQLLRVLSSTLLLFVCTTVVLLTVQAVAIRPQPSYIPAISLMLDIARAECATGSAADRSAGRSRFPAALIVTMPGDDICAHFDPWIHDPLLYVHDPDTQSHERLPENAQELAAIESAWWQALRAHPVIVIGGKLRIFSKLLLQTDDAYFPGPTSAVNGGLAGWTVQGRGTDEGWPPRGGVPLVLAVAPALLIDTASGLWIAVLPLVMAFVIRRRRPMMLRRLAPLLVFPIWWTANFAAVAPASEARYVAPAAFWGFLSVVIAMAMTFRVTSRQYGAFDKRTR